MRVADCLRGESVPTALGAPAGRCRTSRSASGSAPGAVSAPALHGPLRSDLVAAEVVSRAGCAEWRATPRGTRRVDRRTWRRQRSSRPPRRPRRAQPQLPSWWRSPAGGPGAACRSRGGSRRRRGTPTLRSACRRTPAPCDDTTVPCTFCAHWRSTLPAVSSGRQPSSLVRAVPGVGVEPTRPLRSEGFKPSASTVPPPGPGTQDGTSRDSGRGRQETPRRCSGHEAVEAEEVVLDGEDLHAGTPRPRRTAQRRGTHDRAGADRRPVGQAVGQAAQQRSRT